MAEYTLHWFQLLTYRQTKYVLYGQGPWVGHMIDWLGLNHHHGRLPDSPVFNSATEAITWLIEKVKDRTFFDNMYGLYGHHAGVSSCSKGCDDREVDDFDVISPKSLLKEPEMWLKMARDQDEMEEDD